MEKEMRFHAVSLKELVIKSKEDTWIVKGTDGHELRLLHNNYVKTSETERYITEGFHDQGLIGFSLYQILNYIEGYTWEKHLRGEERKAGADIAPEESTAEKTAGQAERISKAAEVTLSEKELIVEEVTLAGEEKKIAWWGRMKAWLRQKISKKDGE